MSPDSPNIASLGFGPNSSYHELLTGYFSDLAVESQLGCTEWVDKWFWVGTTTAGHRPGREPVGRQLQ
jgi:hypothetical protein